MPDDRTEFEKMFDDDGGAPAPEGPWERLWSAHLHDRRVPVRLVARSPTGWHVEAEGLRGALETDAIDLALATTAVGWSVGDVIECHVLAFNRDTRELRFYARRDP